jgi:hypothetical protein
MENLWCVKNRYFVRVESQSRIINTYEIKEQLFVELSKSKKQDFQIGSDKTWFADGANALPITTAKQTNFRMLISPRSIFASFTTLKDVNPDIVLAPRATSAYVSSAKCTHVMQHLAMHATKGAVCKQNDKSPVCVHNWTLKNKTTCSFVGLNKGTDKLLQDFLFSSDVVVIQNFGLLESAGSFLNMLRPQMAQLVKHYQCLWFSVTFAIAVFVKQSFFAVYVMEIARDEFVLGLRLPSDDVRSRTDLVNCMLVDKFKIPRWTLARLADMYRMHMPKARVFYHFVPESAEPLSHVMQLVAQREPANVCREKMFDERAMELHFGWCRGFYDEFYARTSQPAANIMLYAPVFVQPKSNLVLNVLHVVCYAFDHKQQSDYLHFVPRNDRAQVLGLRYERMMMCVFRIALFLSLDHVVMSFLGATDLAARFPGGANAFQSKVWFPSFKNAMRHKPSFLKISFMDNTAEHLQILMKQNFPDLQFFEPFGQNLNALSGQLQRILFVRESNPLSMILDRETTSSVACSSLTNPYLRLSKNYINLETL